jgi:predicted anti-sigma-YlaC factor YlaD
VSGAGLVGPACVDARRLVQLVLDHEATPRDASRLEAHLAGCPSCRVFSESLTGIQAALREQPALVLPAHDVERTIGEGSWRCRAGRSKRVPWRLAAAAAVVALAVLGPLMVLRSGHDSAPLSAEEMRAAAELKAVLAIANGALHRSSRTAVRQVFDAEIEPALRKVPVIDRLLSPGAATEGTE